MRPRGLVALSVVAALIAVLALPAIAGSASAASMGVTARAIDDSLPGIETTATHITGTLDAMGADDDDIYRVHLEAGTQLTVMLTADSGTDFDVEMYRFNAENDRLELISRTSGQSIPSRSPSRSWSPARIRSTCTRTAVPERTRSTGRPIHSGRRSSFPDGS